MMTWQELLDIHAAMPEAKPVICRLYHDERGHPLFYSLDDLPGNYIEVDKETYLAMPFTVRVVNGKLIWLTVQQSIKLRPDDSGTPCHPQDVAVVDAASTTYWSKHFYGESD